MKYVRFRYLYLVAIAILATNLIGFTGCTGSAENTLAVPEFEEPEPPPVEVTIDQLYAEYIADEVAANTRYKNERLLIYEVEVEQVGGEWIYIGLGEWVFEKTYFIR